VSSAFAERLSGGRYIDMPHRRRSAARLRLEYKRRASVVAAAGAETTSAKRSKACSVFPINVRYPRDARDSSSALRRLPMLTARGRSFA